MFYSANIYANEATLGIIIYSCINNSVTLFNPIIIYFISFNIKHQNPFMMSINIGPAINYLITNQSNFFCQISTPHLLSATRLTDVAVDAGVLYVSMVTPVVGIHRMSVSSPDVSLPIVTSGLTHPRGLTVESSSR